MRLKVMFVISVLVLVAAACGGGTDGTDDPATTVDAGGTETPSAPTDQTPSDSPPQASAPSGSGEFTIDGQSFKITQVVRCEPLDDADNPDNLDVVASTADGVHLSLVISNNQAYGDPSGAITTYHDLRINRFADGGQEQYNSSASHDSDNVWSMGGQDGEILSGPPFVRSGNSISGGMTIAKDYPVEDGTTLDVTFNFDFPSDFTDC